jgi:2'-5' RNA ligase
MKRAIDIVVLPPQHIYKDVIELSALMNKGVRDSEILLGNTYIPHITLVHACVDENEFPSLHEFVARTLKYTRPFALTADKIIDDGNGFFALNILPNAELTALHKILLQKLKTMHTKPVTADAFIVDPGQTINDMTIQWVTTFIDNLIRDQSYWPHITLAQNSNFIPDWNTQTFTADRIAICHVGNNCTCRKILHEWKLR